MVRSSRNGHSRWIPDYPVAFLVGIVFRYFAIAQMRGLGLAGGVEAEVKVDTASITSWKVGICKAVTFAQFAWLRPTYGAIAPVDSFEFWFVMQIAMIAGFATAYSAIGGWSVPVLRKKM